MTDSKLLQDRKPARKVADVPNDVLHWLNQGVLSTKNLTEWLAIDHVELIFNALPDDWATRLPSIKQEIKDLKKPSTLKITNLIGAQLFTLARNEAELNRIQAYLLNHPADSVRCYYGALVAAMDISLTDKLEKILPLAADEHFGCREVAFFAFKPAIIDQEKQAIKILTPLVSDSDENLRRFAVETTRPIGVWTTHLPKLKEQPELGISLLAPLKNDLSRYVQNAVGNWLNDAAKSKPTWVKNLAQEWLTESNTKATQYIVKRGTRSL